VEPTPAVEIEQNPSSKPIPSKAEDPTQNEVGAEDKNVSGIDTGLFVDEPKVQAS